MIIFICTFLWSSMSFSTSTHFGNTLLCKETMQCHSATSGQILIPHYNAITLSLRHTLGDKIDNARLKKKKQIWPNGLAELNTVLVQNCNDQLCNWSTIELPRNGAKCKCKLLKSCQANASTKTRQRVVQDNALKLWDRLWHWMSQLSQQGVFKWIWSVLSMTEEKFGK